MLKKWKQQVQRFPPRRWRCCGVTKERCLQFGSTRMANIVWAAARTAPCGYGTHTRVCTSRLIPVTLAMFVMWLSQGDPLVANLVISAIASWIKKCQEKFPQFQSSRIAECRRGQYYEHLKLNWCLNHAVFPVIDLSFYPHLRKCVSNCAFFRFRRHVWNVCGVRIISNWALNPFRTLGMSWMNKEMPREAVFLEF